MVGHRLVKRTAKSIRLNGENAPDMRQVLQSTSPKLNPAQDLRFSLYTELWYGDCYNKMLKFSYCFQCNST